MPDPRPVLLLTRPEAQSARFAAEVRGRFGADWPVLIAPLMEVAPLTPAIPPADELIFTSENALEAFVRLEPAGGRPAWCVGKRTAKAAERAGFAVHVGPGTSGELALRMLAAGPRGRILHPRGAQVAHNIAETLRLGGLAAQDVVVYEQIALGLPPRLRAMLTVRIPILVPLFSPRSAALFATEARDAEARLLLAPISRNAAEPLHGLPNSRIEIAETPDASAVLAAMERLIRPFVF